MRLLHIVFYICLCILGVQSSFAADNKKQNCANGYKLHSRNISTADGLTSNAINEMVQDTEGYIWMATNNGLSRYDGYVAVNYSSVACDDEHHLHARIGRIYHDPSDNLLWLNTATYQIACYDLAHARFTDWSGGSDCYKQFNKMMLTRQGMVLYGAGLGARLSHKESDGRFSMTEWTRSNGSLPNDDVLMVVEDSLGNVWLPTKRGISVNGTIVDSTHCIIAAAAGKEAFFLTNEGEVLVYDNKQLKKTFAIPSTIGRPRKVNTSFLWQGLWMQFTPDGTYAIDLKQGITSKPQQWQVADGLNQSTCDGYHFIGTRKGELWIFPETGTPQRLDLIANAQLTTYKGWLFHVVKDRSGRLFIATYGAGLYVYDTANGSLTNYTANDRLPLIGSNYLMSAMTDRQGNIWLATETAGTYCITVVDSETANFTNLDTDNQGEWSNTISTLTLQKDGRLFIGMRDGHTFTATSGNTAINAIGDRHKVAVKAYLIDSKGREWIGTWGNGLTVDGKHYCTADTINNITSDFIKNIIEGTDGTIWIGTWNSGIVRFNENGKMTQMTQGNINSNRINDIVMGADGTLWAATQDGVLRLAKDGSMTMFNTSNNLFPNDEANDLFIIDDTLWVATSGGVVKCNIGQDANLNILGSYTIEQGLSNNSAMALTKDMQGNIWVGTEDGISRIDKERGTVNSYRFTDSPQGNITSAGCALTTANGNLIFGTADGLLTINPQRFSNGEARPLIITNMTVNGTAHLSDRPTEMEYDQNKLTFFFSCFEYSNLQRPMFQYYLEGSEKEWQNTTTQNRAAYNNLRPGRYTFHVRTLDTTGQWQQAVTYSFTIMQPWYNRWWAWMIYIATALLAGFYVYGNWRERFELHQQMAMERQLSELRQNLFTNITHEFRTPLAIIKGAVDKLAEDGSNKVARHTAQRATNRMLRMVNQFMEFRKIRTGNLRLQVEEGDLAMFIRDIVNDLWIIANQKSQQLTFIPTERHMTATFDMEMVETMVYNLISNAIKYTPERGDINVRLRKADDTFVLTVEDSGPGIDRDKQESLFKPFMNGYAARGGMGIGLYTTHEMAKTHKGSLSYNRISEAGGSKFTLRLPATDVYSEKDYRDTPLAAIETKERSESTGEPLSEILPEALNDKVVAIIEDDADMMEQIKTEVGVYFKIECYASGQAAIDGIVASKPSLVICDVMLPDMDGYDIVSRLKNDSNTSSLPIIMLTALNDETHQIRAYKAGADDYMVKPCNFRLLIARAMQLMKWSLTAAKQKTDRDSSETKTPQPSLIDNRLDKLFLEKLEKYTNQNLSNETFNIDRLAEMMNMGRTKFYGKVKELTGMSPNKYLQEARMRRAGELLLEGKYTISEVSYKVGIQDPSYFNKVFKAHFGVVPSKYGRS